MHKTLPLFGLAALASLAGCAHHLKANAGPDREAVSGLPVSFGDTNEKAPEGTTVRWDFGDGTKADGQQVVHAFPRAGVYKVKETVKDADGERVSEATLTVRRRPPAAAVPPNARSVFIFDRLFARVSHDLATIERFAGSERAGAMVHAAEELLGFDPTRPEQLEAAGIDPEEGFATAQLPDDPGMWIIVGTFDDQKAKSAAQRALSKNGPVQFTSDKDGGLQATVGLAKYVVMTRGGYLYVHLPDQQNPSAGANVASITGAREDGLFGDPLFARLRQRVEGDDLFAFIRAKDIPRSAAVTGTLSAVIERSEGLAVGVKNAEGQLGVDGLLAVDEQGRKSMQELFNAPHSLEIAARAPAGAAAFVSASLHAQSLLALAGAEGTDSRAELDRTSLQVLGMPLAELVGLLTGDLGAALYIDPAGFYRDIAARQNPTPKFNAVAALGVSDAAKMRAAITHAVDALREKGQAGPKAAGDRWSWKLGGEPLELGLEKTQLVVGFGQKGAQAFKDDKDVRRLSSAIASVVPQGLLQKPHVFAWLDVGGTLDAVRNPGPIEGIDPAQQAFLQSMVSTLLEDPNSPVRALLPIREAVFTAAPDEAGLAAKLTIHLR